MQNKKIKLSIFIISLLLSICYIAWYCSIYFYPKINEMQIIEPESKIEEMVITTESAPTISCHASTIALFNDDIYCAWFGGTQEGAPDVTIYLSKKTATGWSNPINMSNIKNIAHYNPVLFTYNDTLYLYYKIGSAPSKWVTYYRYTKDGLTWSNEEKLIENDKKGRGPVKNKPIVVSNGSILAPCSYEFDFWMPKSFVDISYDAKTWKMSKTIKGALAVLLIQPTLIELENGHIIAYTRSNAKRIFRSDSYDYGKTWSRSTATTLYNNNSGIDAVKTDDDIIAVVHNPIGENWGSRSPLVIGLSYDHGNSFTKQIILENIEGEFSYPSIITKNNTLYISYTYNRQLIKFVEIKL